MPFAPNIIICKYRKFDIRKVSAWEELLQSEYRILEV